AADPPPALLRGPDAVADRAADRDLADARLATDPPVAGEDSRRDRVGGARRAAATRRLLLTKPPPSPHLESTPCGRAPNCARASSPSSRRRATCAARRTP